MVKYKNAVRKVMYDIKVYNIKPKDDITNIKPYKPYQRPYSEELFKHVKLENLREVENLLDFDKFLVFQIDHVFFSVN